MKLRIKGNSLRFRLSRSDVETFGRTGKVEERVDFGAQSTNPFCYVIEKTAQDSITASFADGKITVSVPENIANLWIATDQIGFEGRQELDDLKELHFLVEKDFVCLTAPEHEDQSDNYPHPKGEKSC